MCLIFIYYYNKLVFITLTLYSPIFLHPSNFALIYFCIHPFLHSYTFTLYSPFLLQLKLTRTERIQPMNKLGLIFASLSSLLYALNLTVISILFSDNLFGITITVDDYSCLLPITWSSSLFYLVADLIAVVIKNRFNKRNENDEDVIDGKNDGSISNNYGTFSKEVDNIILIGDDDESVDVKEENKGTDAKEENELKKKKEGIIFNAKKKKEISSNLLISSCIYCLTSISSILFVQILGAEIQPMIESFQIFLYIILTPQVYQIYNNNAHLVNLAVSIIIYSIGILCIEIGVSEVNINDSSNDDSNNIDDEWFNNDDKEYKIADKNNNGKFMAILMSFIIVLLSTYNGILFSRAGKVMNLFDYMYKQSIIVFVFISVIMILTFALNVDVTFIIDFITSFITDGSINIEQNKGINIKQNKGINIKQDRSKVCLLENMPYTKLIVYSITRNILNSLATYCEAISIKRIDYYLFIRIQTILYPSMCLVFNILLFGASIDLFHSLSGIFALFISILVLSMPLINSRGTSN